MHRGAQGCTELYRGAKGAKGARLGRVGDARVDRAVARALVGAARRDAHAPGQGDG